MQPFLKASDKATLLDRVAPISQGVGTVTTGWVNAALFNQLLGLIAAGVMGASATIDGKFQQATDSGGTGAKDVTGSAITQLVKATDDNKFTLISLDPQKLDVNGGFSWVRLSITVGTAASLIYGAVLGLEPRYGVAAHNAALKQDLNVN
jgi:hypothetical protein